MLSGELFAGVGGLGMAVDEVFGSKPAWFCEFDKAPSKVLEHRYPGVPNLGDVRTVDFRSLPHTHIRCGGFPCQDVSVSGGRRGMRDGTRSGLWSEFARSIDEDRPDWVVIENVGGLLSAGAHSDVEPCPWCLGDDPDQHALRALGAVLGDLAALGFDAEWTSLRASDIGAPHGRLRVFILAWPTENTGRGKARGINGNGMGMPLPIAVQLLQTPRTTDMNGPGVHGDGGLDLRTAVTMMPTPRATRGGSSTEMAYALGGARSDDARTQGQVLLPTPAASLGEHRRDYGQPPEARRAGGHSVSTADAVRGVADAGTLGWGPYAAAVQRWEHVIGRPAPSPVRHDGKGGKARLNPELTEWMMGWPAGWVTDPAIGLSRAEQLKVCGNGVVRQQAAAALRELLARPGVPVQRDLCPGCDFDPMAPHNGKGECAPAPVPEDRTSTEGEAA